MKLTLAFVALTASLLVVAWAYRSPDEAITANTQSLAASQAAPTTPPAKPTIDYAALAARPMSEKVFPPPDMAPDAAVNDEPEPVVAGKKLVGIFRGDWGEFPTYQKNDRVNWRRASYLSLRHANHGNPPDVSPDYWVLLKQLVEVDQDACLRPGPGTKLKECDFTTGEVNLSGMDLSGADLSKARLSGELGSANLSGANLSGAAVLGKLVISPETRLDHANLSGLQSSGNNPVIAEKADLTGSNLSKANLYGSNLQGATLTSANLTGSTLTGSNLTGTHFDGASLDKSDMSYANLSSGDLRGATLADSDLTQADLSHAHFTDSKLNGANLAGAQLSEVDFSGANLRGANLAEAQGADSAHIDSRTDFSGATCPDGVTVDGTRVTTCVGHGF